VKDQKFLEEIRKLPCIACGKHGPSEAHHVQTRGSGGSDDWWNILPLCHGHHTANGDAWHRGKISFLEKFPHVLEHLEKLGWSLFNGKLIPPCEPQHRE
jgi:hypothetical protein